MHFQKNSQSDGRESSVDGITNIELASVASLQRKLTLVEETLRVLRQENKNIIVGVLVALVLIVVTVAVEVIFFHAR